MPWRHQIMRKINEHPLIEEEKYYYEVHEYYYDGPEDCGRLGKPGWTQEGMKPYGFSKEDLIESLESMLKAAKKHGVRDFETGELIDTEI